MQTPPLAPGFDILVKAFEQIQTAHHVRLASNTMIFYDYVITFDREIDLIWKREWQFSKGVFLINRYYVLASAIFNNYVFFTPVLSNEANFGPQFSAGHNYYLWEGWTGLIGCMLVQIILQMRIYAIYRRNKLVLYLMFTSFLACSIASAIIMGINLRGLGAHPMDIPNGRDCFSNTRPHLYAFWIPMLSFESLLCILALIHGYKDYRDGFHGLKAFRVIDHHRLSDILVRDSIIYFLAIGAVYLACLVVWNLDQNALIEAPIGYSIAVSSALGSRLILNLREMNTTQKSQYLPDIRALRVTNELAD